MTQRSHHNGLMLGALFAAGAIGVAAGVRRARSIDLAGLNVLITGGSRGLGLALAREFARHGARIAICGRDADTLERARADLTERGAVVFTSVCDVTDRAAVARMMREVGDAFGTIDVLVNNAGVIQVGPLETMTLEDFQASMAGIFWGAVHTTLAVLPSMRERGRGRIVNITSIGGKISVPHLVPYSAAKFALVGFSEGLRAELAGSHVVVTTVVPGLMRTGSPRNAEFKGRHRAEYAWFSVSDALPGLSIDVERAARQIVAACRRGAAEVILSLPAQVATRIHGLFPGAMSTVLGLVSRSLPAPGGIGTASAKGHESFSSVSPSWLTALDEAAARRHNQVPGSSPPSMRSA